MQREENKNLSILYVLFFISGVAALVYQIVWQRLLTYFTGSDITSISLIVSAYMAGLGLGSLAGGIISDRVSQKKRLLWFGISEALIGVFALCSKYLFYDYLYGVVTENQLNNVFIFLILFMVLLVPTFLMGASLPLLSKSYISTIEHSVSVIGKLYFVNTLGAAFGAMLPILTVRYMGFTHTLWLTSLLNFLCFAGALYLYRESLSNELLTKPLIKSPEYGAQKTSLPGKVIFWVVICCLTGFIAVSFEIVWFRMITVICKPLYITFPVLLGVYIAGMAIGSRFTRFIPYSYNRKAKAFFWVQFSIALYILLSIVFFLYAIKYVPFFQFIYKYLELNQPTTSAFGLLGLYGGIVPYFIFIPTVLMGFSFVLLQSLLQDDFSTVGRKVGLAQFTNIAGSSIGALVASYLFINYLGSADTFKLLIGLSIALVVIVFLIHRNDWGVKKESFYLLAASCAVLYFAFPSQSEFWSRLHGKEPGDIIVVEDATGIAAIKINKDPLHRNEVFCNGKGQGEMYFGADDYHVAFGLVPMILHPAPVDIAIIGLGGGNTLYGVAGRSDTKSITCFEIIEPQKEMLEVYNKRFNVPAITGILSDPRVSFSFGDARFALKTSDKKYDIIEADAMHLNSAYSGNLYSKEYFELLKSKLNPGGYAVTWAPSPRIVETVNAVFKHTILYNGIMVGSDSLINPEDIQLKDFEFTHNYYAKSGIEIDDFILKLKEGYKISSNDRFTIDNLNTDLYPKDEFGVPQVK